MRTVFTVLFVFLFLVLSIPFLGFCWVMNKIHPGCCDMAQLRVVQWAFRVVSFLSGVKLTVIGEENVPKDEAVLYICNHRSFFDIVITYARCPGLTGYVAKIGVKKVPLLSTYMERLHCLFIDRDDLKQSLKIILAAIDLVKSGISVCIFPEGTRNKDWDHPENIQAFKEGSFKIATKTGCRIVPMALVGTDDILERHFPWIRSRRITLVYGQPIDPNTLSKEEKKQIGAYTQKVIQQMLNEQLGIENNQ